MAVNTASFASIKDWKQFWKSKNAGDVTWATDLDGRLVRLFKVYSLGTTIIIDRRGLISYRDAGATPHHVLLAKVKEVL